MRPDELLGPTFVVYHDVVAAAGGDVSRARTGFAAQIRSIVSAGFRFASMGEFLAGAALGPRDVVVTVDDGARSFREVMWPVLKEHGAVPTIFVLSSFAGRRGRGVEFLGWDELSELAAEGVEIGCHGASHVPFDEVSTDRMHAEILHSTEQLREYGFSPRVLAYPFGRFNDAAKAAVRDAGYEAAFTVMAGGRDRFEIRRKLLTGLEAPLSTRFVMSRAFFSVREAVRAVTPRAWLRQERPIEPERWGPGAFGIEGDA